MEQNLKTGGKSDSVTGSIEDISTTDMKFKFKNIGYVDDGEMTLGDLTIICGSNNVGKTYLSYAIYGFLKHFRSLADIKIDKNNLDKLQVEGICQLDLNPYAKDAVKILDHASKNFSQFLPRFFNTNDEFFAQAYVEFAHDGYAFSQTQAYHGSVKFSGKELIRLSKEEGDPILTILLQSDHSHSIPKGVLDNILSEHIASVLFKTSIPRPFVITSERTGIALFYKELDYSKSAILDHLIDSDKVNPIALLNTLRSRYAEPIKDNIDIVRDYDALSKQKSPFLTEDAQNSSVLTILARLTGGSFKMLNKQMMYLPRKERGRNKLAIPIYMASSSIKSLFLMDLYIRHIAKKGDILIIDEPELNLHPDNQRQMAYMLARLVNSGIQVLCTTHSDFLVREINNLIMLNRSFSEKQDILTRYNITPQEILKPEQVHAFTVTSKHRIEAFKTDEHGVDLKLFDELIRDANRMADDIYYTTEES